MDRNDQPRWNDIWNGSPILARPGEPGDFALHRNGGHCRPYIAAQDRERYVFRPGTLPGPGEIHFDAWERHRIAGRRERWQGFVVIEPNLKPKAAQNKDWGWGRYLELTERLAGIRLVQLGPAGTRLLPGAEHIETATFREAAATLSIATAYVGAEGGLHHAAAALGIPAVVIFGGFIAPSVTGYARPRGAEHRNIYVDSSAYPHGCGWRRACEHCRDAMRTISAERVASELTAILAARAAA